MPVVQPRRGRHGDEELATVRARARVSHGKHSSFRMLQRRVKLVGKLVSWPSHSAALRAAALDHELWNHAMKNERVVERRFLLLPVLFVCKLFCAFGKPDEIGNCLGGLFFEQPHHDVSLGSFKYGVRSCRPAHAFSLSTESSYMSRTAPRHFATLPDISPLRRRFVTTPFLGAVP